MIVKEHIKIFGTDGVRGRANQAPMTVETALALGRAAGKIFKTGNRRHRVVIGKDTRLSCYMFENALIAGLCSMGIDTLMVGPLPTPGVAFITRAYRADAGIVISASHNPYFDNGIKFFSSGGFKLPDSWEKMMETLVNENHFSADLPSDKDIGKNTKIIDADGRYIEFVKATFPKKMSLQGIKIVLDCANGAGYKVAPLVFKELDAEVIIHGNAPNGLNINLNCGALHPEIAQKSVIEHNADVGIALDGDADRIIMIDENGKIVDGDVILAICAIDMMEKGTLANNRVVGTVMSNLGFIKCMQEHNIEVIQAQVGDRYVIQAMQEHACNLGGEQSGHLIFLDLNTTGDALIAALQVLQIIKEKGKSLSELASVVQRYPQTLINVHVRFKPPIDDLAQVQAAKLEAIRQLACQGRVLLRYSGTENILRVMVEGENAALVQQLAENIAKAVKDDIGEI